MITKIIQIAVILFTISILSVSAQNKETITETLSMEAGYANDIFYSMSDGVVESVIREGWDIAFYTPAMSAGIMINEGSGVELYTYPNGGIDSWNHIDTTGFSTWSQLNNSPTLWENGAFNSNATIHPNYGWGNYNSITHDVVGDSIFIIFSPEFGYKKIWIVDKISTQNIYNIKYANIDGTNEITKSIDVKPFNGKNFIYYSLVTNELIDREPTANWDILFTKYFDYTTNTSGGQSGYIVTGATSNINTGANKYYPVDATYVDWAVKLFETTKNTVGYNWKYFDMTTFSFVIEDSTAFFVKDYNDDVYKLTFNFWEGMSTGIFGLTKEIISLSNINSNADKEHVISLFPNPSSGFVNINLGNSVVRNASISIIDLTGKVVYNAAVNNSANSIKVSTNNFESGLYFVTVYTDDFSETAKLIIQ